MSDLRERIAEIVREAAIRARRGRVRDAANDAADEVMALLDTADSGWQRGPIPMEASEITNGEGGK